MTNDNLSWFLFYGIYQPQTFTLKHMLGLLTYFETPAILWDAWLLCERPRHLCGRPRALSERPSFFVRGPGLSAQGPSLSVRGPRLSVRGPGPGLWMFSSLWESTSSLIETHSLCDRCSLSVRCLVFLRESPASLERPCLFVRIPIHILSLVTLWESQTI